MEPYLNVNRNEHPVTLPNSFDESDSPDEFMAEVLELRV